MTPLMVTIGTGVSATSKPRPRRPLRIRLTLRDSLERLSVVCRIRNDAAAAAANPGGAGEAPRMIIALRVIFSAKVASPGTTPPSAPNALLIVPARKLPSPSSPACCSDPRPVSPSTPTPWESSMHSNAPS